MSGDRLLLDTEDGPVDFVPGVNIGATTPGHLPGELAIRDKDYRRWFPQIASLGLRAVRVYTILTPGFYRELAAYNRRHPDSPLYLMQGVWIPEDEFYESEDLYAPAVRDGFKAEIADAVGAVHGDVILPPEPGHASGRYTADVSPWMLAYSIGVEWDPQTTFASDRLNARRAPFVGTFFASTGDASPTESWLSEMLDHLAQQEAAQGRTMPLTFTNWLTTDPLEHPEEPLAEEDIVGVDANHVRPTDAWPGGFFASYHAYPYYPDFLRHEPELASCQYLGQSDPYAGYLAALRTHHSMPVMITEFGVPSSAGLAHYGALGRDQGDHSEQDQMEVDAELLRMFHTMGFSGAFVFEWVDEWFKFTWNTIDYELPTGRRQLWRNAWTNEEHFGLVAAEPGAQSIVLVDGSTDEWRHNRSQVIFEGRDQVRQVRAVKDEAYLYLLIRTNRPIEWKRSTIALGFNVLGGGNRGLPAFPEADVRADYAVTLGPLEQGRAWVRASNDAHVILYGLVHDFMEIDRAALQEGSGVWYPQRLMANRPLVVPSTGERLAMEDFDVGSLRYGTSDPLDPDFDSRTVWNRSANAVELRIPYAAMGFSDPSSRRAIRVTLDGGLETQRVERVGISIALNGRSYLTSGYSWDPWNAVTWHERPKAGIEIFAEAVADVTSHRYS